jgi:membrane protease YdiL (CAAX protease family)
MTVFAVVGFIGTQIMYDQPPLPTDFVPNGSDEKNKKYISDTILQTAIILFAAMATQLTVQTALSFTIKEQASYFIFAAICEEVLFRVFILSVGFKLVPGAEKLWQAATAAEKIMDRIRLKGQVLVRLSGFLILQAALFGAIHQNYYGNWPMLLSVILGGLILGIFFIWWRNPTANILAHFLLNVIAVQNLLVLL